MFLQKYSQISILCRRNWNNSYGYIFGMDIPMLKYESNFLTKRIILKLGKNKRMDIGHLGHSQGVQTWQHCGNHCIAKSLKNTAEIRENE